MVRDAIPANRSLGLLTARAPTCVWCLVPMLRSTPQIKRPSRVEGLRSGVKGLIAVQSSSLAGLHQGHGWKTPRSIRLWKPPTAPPRISPSADPAEEALISSVWPISKQPRQAAIRYPSALTVKGSSYEIQYVPRSHQGSIDPNNFRMPILGWHELSRCRYAAALARCLPVDDDLIIAHLAFLIGTKNTCPSSVVSSD